jgi:hypothetical protein
MSSYFGNVKTKDKEDRIKTPTSAHPPIYFFPLFPRLGCATRATAR